MEHEVEQVCRERQDVMGMEWVGFGTSSTTTKSGGLGSSIYGFTPHKHKQILAWFGPNLYIQKS